MGKHGWVPLGVWEGLRFAIVALPGPFSYLFLCTINSRVNVMWFLLRQTMRTQESRVYVNSERKVEIIAFLQSDQDPHVSSINSITTQTS